MSRIRKLKPSVEPPKDRPVIWFGACGSLTVSSVRPSHHVVAWCEPPTLTVTSGPVHSLEAQELPAEFARVLLYLEPHRDYPYVGYWDGENWMVDRYATGDAVCVPRGWRPLPDDEPGDAELLESAAALVVGAFRSGISTSRDIREAIDGLERALKRGGGK